MESLTKIVTKVVDLVSNTQKITKRSVKNTNFEQLEEPRHSNIKNTPNPFKTGNKEVNGCERK